ncbi:hypothetical protein GY45DRAFT_356621 [Cubamyces sp. BRFM 1775]|nr:hypothetical protein GY45DRAFT_356621 [Cubamyces sp. BRFM 1775]
MYRESLRGPRARDVLTPSAVGNSSACACHPADGSEILPEVIIDVMQYLDAKCRSTGQRASSRATQLNLNPRSLAARPSVRP